MADVDMGAFWDERARENAAYFVENRLDYGETDLDEFWATGSVVVDQILAATGATVGPEDELVELGCGLGRLTRVLAGRARSVAALDVSAEMLHQAREHNGHLDNVRWQHCDGRSLTAVQDASADGFFSHVVFQHLPDPAITYGYVTEMGRVLRPGGWSVFHVSDDPSIHVPRGGPRLALHRALAAAGRAPKGSTHPAWLGSAVDLARLRATAEAAGLEVEHVTGQGTQFCFVRLRRR